MLAITIQPKDTWVPKVDRNVMTLYFASTLAQLFSEAGFQDVHVEIPPQEDKVFLECILGVI